MEQNVFAGLVALTLRHQFEKSWTSIAAVLDLSAKTVQRRVDDLVGFGTVRNTLKSHGIKYNVDLLQPGEVGDHIEGKFVVVSVDEEEEETTVVFVDGMTMESLSIYDGAVRKERKTPKKAPVEVAKPKRSRKAKKAAPAEEATTTPKKRVRKAKKATPDVAVEQPTSAAPVPAKKPVEIPKHMITAHVLTIIRNGKPQNIDKSHPHFKGIKQALEEKKFDKAYELMDARKAMEIWSMGRAKVVNNTIHFDGKAIHPHLSEKLMEMIMKDGTDKMLQAWVKFLEKVDANPSRRVISRIYEFMKAKDITIDEDGDLRCWKVVCHDYLDKHSRTFDNGVGKVVEMKRNDVDDNDDVTCSNGLHVCSKSYIRSFGSGNDRIVECKVSPTDWVSVPRDYNDAKARVCKYLVVADVTDTWGKELR